MSGLSIHAAEAMPLESASNRDAAGIAYVQCLNPGGLGEAGYVDGLSTTDLPSNHSSMSVLLHTFSLGWVALGSYLTTTPYEFNSAPIDRSYGHIVGCNLPGVDPLADK